MTYERYKTGTFRVCVFLTIVLEATIILHPPSDYFLALITTPILIWGTFFTSLWIINGYLGKK